MPTTATIATATTATAKIELTRVLRIKKPFAVDIISFSTFGSEPRSLTLEQSQLNSCVSKQAKAIKAT